MNFTPNLVAGIVITLVGVALMLDRLGVLEAQRALSLWPALLTLFGISVVVQALRGHGDRPSAPQPRPIIGPGLVLVVIVGWILATSGNERRFVASGGNTDTQITLVGLLGEDNRTIVATGFRGAVMTSVMGRTRLDLRQAMLAPGNEATVDVLGLMGGLEVIVPDEWTVDLQATTVMGNVRDRRRSAVRVDDQKASGSDGPAAVQEPKVEPSAVGPTPRVVVRGLVMMGGLVLRS